MREATAGKIAPMDQPDRRGKKRIRFTGLLPGLFRTQAKGQIVVCRPVDIGEAGLGILSQFELNVGDQIVLECKSIDLNLIVEWKKRDFGKQDLWRYGLSLVDSEVDVIELFSSTGCIR